jgi:hypothetical protein
MMNAMVTTDFVIDPVPRRPATPLPARLRDLHRHWLSEAAEWLTPTLARDADFWNGWSAVRYLNDQFARQYQRECALVAAILPLLQPADAFSLCAATVVLERTRRDLDRLGRRQGMTEVVAALSCRFLKLLNVWLAEIERVTEELTINQRPGQGRQALAQLRAAAGACQ